jgi:hypothetical protein
VGWILRDIFLALHIVSGAVALTVGPLALLAAAHRHSRREHILTGYLWAVFATCLTAVAVCLLDWSRLWWLVPVAVLSYLLALAEIVAWILPAAVGVPSIVRAHTGARAERPMRGPL